MSNETTSILLDKVNELRADLPIDEFDNEDLVEKLNEFKRDFTSKKEASERKAKMLIQRCAELFLDADMLNDSEYARYKKEIDEYSLSNTLFQLHTSHLAIEKLSQKIVVEDSGNSRHYEVLGTLQRVVLDINKFMLDYMNSMEESYRELRDKIIDMRIEKSMDSVEDVQGGDNNRIAFTTRDGAELVRQLEVLVGSVEDLERIPSSNPRLAKDGDDQDKVIELNDTDAESEDEYDNDSSGSFGGFEY